MAAWLIRTGRPSALPAHRYRTPLEPLLSMGATEAASAAELAGSLVLIYNRVPNPDEVRLLGCRATKCCPPRPQN